MAEELLSPTCGDCARAKGYVPVAPWATMYGAECANCHEQRAVSTADDWKLPGQKTEWWMVD